MVAEPSMLPPVRDGDPCAAVRGEAERTCTDAEQKAVLAGEQLRRLRDLRGESAAVAEERAAGARLRDRRAIAAAKDDAALQYRRALTAARQPRDMQEAAAEWLRAVDALNRDARIAATREEGLARRALELHQLVPAAEVAANTARVAAEVAGARCAEARQAVAECEEATGASAPPATAEPEPEPQPSPARLAAQAEPEAAETPVSQAEIVDVDPGAPHADRPTALPLPVRGVGLAELLTGDRQPVLRLALQLASETGLEAGRLQLLLMELREAIVAGALADQALAFPPQHPFWSQFSAAGVSSVATSLALLGFRFDGHGGWADGRVPHIRDLALALTHAGFDPRSLRRPAGQAAIDGLWQGTLLVPANWLLARAPALEMEAVRAALGERAARLADMWPIWEQVRLLLAR